ncbi:complement decay-accelerating factor-like [Pelobates fuscus]|uniref:complement decay-accelerating factor-like n=1 Tax=Pelobates fuscus TaxID=191477 RepID=UPI002FE4C998
MFYSYAKWMDTFKLMLLCIMIINTQGDPCKFLEFSNGVVEYSGILPGSIATFTCHEGYHLSGDTSMQCLEDGQWKGILPICQRTSCGLPDFIDNGELEMTSVSSGFVVRYSCHTGYVLFGPESRTCLETGFWSDISPTCKRTCPSPPKPSFAEIVQLPDPVYFPAGIYINYECLPGFDFDPFQARSVKCQENFIWSEITEFCTIVSCEMPENITNGIVEVTDITFGFKANYSCNDGYILIGNPQLQCTADGVWSDNAPECTSIPTTVPTDSTPITLITPTVIQSEPVTTTQGDECEKIQAIQESLSSCTSTPEEWTKYLQIQYLYLQIENLKLDIAKKKTEA